MGLMNSSGIGMGNGLPPQLMQSIQNIKGIMKMANGNPQQILQQMGGNNPMFNQVMQMCNGQNPEKVFYDLCKQQGIDPQAVLKQLQN